MRILSNNRTVTTQEYAVKSTIGGDANTLIVRAWYEIGGPNYSGGGTLRRGYYISVTPETRADGFVSFIAFSGSKECVREVSRFTQSEFEKFVEWTRSDPEGVAEVQLLIAHVMHKNGLVFSNE